MKYGNFWTHIEFFDRGRKDWSSAFNLPKKLISLTEYIKQNYKFNEFNIDLLIFLVIYLMIFSLLSYGGFRNGNVFDNIQSGMPYIVILIVLSTPCALILLFVNPFQVRDRLKSSKQSKLVEKNPQKIVDVIEKDVKNVKEFTQKLIDKHEDLAEKIKKFDSTQAKEYALKHYKQNVKYIEFISNDHILSLFHKEARAEQTSIIELIKSYSLVRVKLEEQQKFFETL